MKCPKCGYLGFERVERCRNCGYDFSLSVPAAIPELPLRSDATEVAPLDDLSDIAAVLGDAAIDSDLSTVPLGADSAFPWPDLARMFDPAGRTSYWWSAPRPGRLQSGLTHAGALDATLFVTLFGDAREPHGGSGASVD